jgi:hypothetical protein
VLDECAALLYSEIQIRSSAGGLGINIQVRAWEGFPRGLVNCHGKRTGMGG